MEEWVKEVKLRAELGKPLIGSGRAASIEEISWDKLIFLPVQLTKRPVDYYREEISTETVLGKLSKSPLKLRTPILIAPMSYGAISKEAKIALAKASTQAGTATNTGEGGMLLGERKNAKLLIAQYSTGRFGVDEEYIKSADAIEIKIGQGAKVGLGGFLPAEKVTKEIAKIRKVPVGQPVYQPPYHLDIRSIRDLKEKIDWIKELNGGKPVIIKLGAGRVEEDVRLAIEAEPDAIAIDGRGATGAAPKVSLTSTGIPSLPALVKARSVLDELGAKQELLIGGGLNDGGDVAKALALGADAVFMGMAILVAMGCTYCRLCYTGKCPVGIATQDPKLRKRLNVEEACRKVVNFITACTEEIKMIAAACGKRDIHELSREDLRATNLITSKITGLALI